MRAATVFGVDDMAVGGELVGANTEHHPQRAAEWQIEATVATHPPGRLGHRRIGAVVTVVPALSGVVAAPQAQHLTTAQPDLAGNLVNLRVAGAQVTWDEPGVLGRRCEQITRPQVTWTDPLIPGHPLWREQCSRTRHQDHFADSGPGGAGTRGNDDGPLPTAVAGQLGQEAVGGRSRVIESGSQVLPDSVLAAELHDRRAGVIDGARKHRRQVLRDIRRHRRIP